MTELKFNDLKKELEDNYTAYQVNNAWFPFSKELDLYNTNSCWSAYQKTNTANKVPLLLGDTKIRSNHELVENFGLSSANGVQEREALPMVAEAQRGRERVAGVGAPAPVGAPTPTAPPMPLAGSAASASASSAAGAPDGAIPVVGSGSILSTAGWSPMLNDCFVMGGIHIGREFKFVMTPEEGTVFQAIPSSGTPKERWHEFFKRYPLALWNDTHNVPRVFARELFGLFAFGYQAVLSMHELSFKRTNQDAANGASLVKYSKTLLDNEMIPRGNKTAVIAKLEDFIYREGKG